MQNQISDWIETAYTTALISTKTDCIETVGSCNVKDAKTTAFITVQGQVTTNTAHITSLQSQLITLGIAQVANGLFSLLIILFCHLYFLHKL